MSELGAPAVVGPGATALADTAMGAALGPAVDENIVRPGDEVAGAAVAAKALAVASPATGGGLVISAADSIFAG